MEKKNQIELGLGIVIILVALTSIALSAVSMTKNTPDTSFTTTQVNQLIDFTTKISFNADNDVVAKGFTTTTGAFLATDGNITGTSLTVEQVKIGTTTTIKDSVFTLGTTTITPTTLTADDITTATGTCINLDCTTIQSGTWNGNIIDVSHGGTGVATLAANRIICGGTTSTGALQQVAAGTTGQFLISQGSSSLPVFADGPNILGSSYIPNVTNLTTTWSVSGPQTSCFYTVIGNNYNVYGQIIATNTAVSPALEPFHVTFQVPGTGTFADISSLRGNADAVDVTTPSTTAIPTTIISYTDVTNRLVELQMVPSSISGITNLNDSWEFNFICSYRI